MKIKQMLVFIYIPYMDPMGNELEIPQILEYFPTWRITPVCEWLVTTIYKPWNGHLEGE